MVSFRDGYKFDDGVRIAPVSRRTYTSSNGYTIYTAVAWADGSTSCNCPGWVFKKKNKPQSCKHSKEVSLFVVGTVPVTADELVVIEVEQEQSMRRRIRF